MIILHFCISLTNWDRELVYGRQRCLFGITLTHKSHRHVYYLSKVWGHLEMSLFLKEKHFFCPLKQHEIDNTVQTLLML
jgi:hypothetical protein